MGKFFDSLQKPGFKAAQGRNSHITQEYTNVAAPVRDPITFAQRFNNRSLTPKSSAKQKKSGSARSSPKPKASRPPKRSLTATPQPLESDSNGDVSDQDLGSARKRQRRDSDVEPDLNRQIRSAEAFSEKEGGTFSMVHAADIASSSKPAKFKAAFPDDTDAVEIYLQYPSASQKEKYGFLIC